MRRGVDVTRSRVYVFVGKTGFGHEHGVEGKIKSGWIALGASKRAGEIIFDMRSFRADTPAARRYVGLSGTTDRRTRRQIDANMLGPSVLDIAHYPTATFLLRSAVPLHKKGRSNATRYRLEGDLTLHGVTQPLRIDVEVVPENEGPRMRGRFSLLQTWFGITPFSKALGFIGVSDQLTIYGDLWLVDPSAKSRQGSRSSR